MWERRLVSVEISLKDLAKLLDFKKGYTIQTIIPRWTKNRPPIKYHPSKFAIFVEHKSFDIVPDVCTPPIGRLIKDGDKVIIKE